tara:strand:- start:482 stop:775 length:294 start_codon:yes stop_codon:yes gene_type:complete
MSEEITPGEGSPMPVVQGHFIALGARQKAKDKGPERLLCWFDGQMARAALDAVRELRKEDAENGKLRTGGHKLVKRSIKVDGSLFDVWCITERSLKP